MHRWVVQSARVSSDRAAQLVARMQVSAGEKRSELSHVYHYLYIDVVPSNIPFRTGFIQNILAAIATLSWVSLTQPDVHIGALSHCVVSHQVKPARATVLQSSNAHVTLYEAILQKRTRQRTTVQQRRARRRCSRARYARCLDDHFKRKETRHATIT